MLVSAAAVTNLPAAAAAAAAAAAVAVTAPFHSSNTHYTDSQPQIPNKKPNQTTLLNTPNPKRKCPKPLHPKLKPYLQPLNPKPGSKTPELCAPSSQQNKPQPTFTTFQSPMMQPPT